jgi:phosphate:Na+ symporter
MDLASIGGALGGLGLFLLGMRMMTDGLKLAAGSMLRDILARWTRTRLRGLFSGILITGLVQSSSAVTVASIGFVNAGVLNLGQAMWVIFGSNVGTTMTGWIVALIGFDFKIEAFALPLLGAGMFLSLTGVTSRRGAIGEAIAGFGIFFLGIATLKATFAGLGQSIDLAAYASGGILNDALFVLLGFSMTTLLQSSSAVIAIALTATVGGVLTIEAGASVVIGANVGTTTTALLSVIGATANAKRVAVSHMAFNVLTGLVALALLPLLLLAVHWLERGLAINAGPAATLALFHTVFNVIGVALMWPLAGWLAKWLSTRFVTAEEDESRPRYLDQNSLEVPALAVSSVLMELRRVADISLGIAKSALMDHPVPVERLWRRNEIIKRLNDAIIEYVQDLHMAKASKETSSVLAHPIRALWHFGEISAHALAIAGRRGEIERLPVAYQNQISGFVTLVAGQLDAAKRAFADPALAAPNLDVLEPAYQNTKSSILEATSSGGLTADQSETALEFLGDMRAQLRLLERAGKRVAAITDVIGHDHEVLD